MKKQLATIVIIAMQICPLVGAFETFPFNLRRAQRRIAAHTVKSAVGSYSERKQVPTQLRNDDEYRYADKHANFNKALNHKDDCFPDTGAFASLVRALDSGSNADFNAIQIGLGRKLVNPQASLAFSLAANDGWINAIPAAPAFTSAQSAGEMVENYWSALMRDVPYEDFDTDTTVADAINDLNDLSDFRGPKIGGVVTSQTLLRGNAPGELEGNYVSQFLLLDIPCGTMLVTQTFLPPMAEDFITDLNDYKTVINGGSTGDSIQYEPTKRYIITPRDLTEYVHKDFPCLPGTNAALIINNYGPAALDKAHPYLNNATQDGFVTYGITELLTLINVASEEGMKAAWYHKWQVNRRLRPEEFGFYVHQQKANNINLGIHEDLMNSPVLDDIYSIINSYLLPQAYPEGSPTHPAYPAGHATFIGAAVTILKAWFDEDFIIPNPQVPTSDGSALVPYTDGDLTLGGELNKLASNIAISRDVAGVHYRSDGWNGMLLGEKVAIDLLNNTGFLSNEDFEGFSLTTFEGKKITVGQKRTA